MKNKKFLSCILILFGLFTLAFSIKGNIMKEETNNSLLNSMSNDSIPGDTTNTDNPENITVINPKDLSTSFNERGFYKSNSFNANGNEIINDFNGNLCYSIPLTSGKGEGDLAYDLSLNYNGNVNYQIICCNAGLNWLSTDYQVYNFCAPGWIFSLNGLAVQMINFETNYFTKPSGTGNTAIGRDVRLLASGYHITDLPTTPSCQEKKDRIIIMLGDGSTETLENTTCDNDSLYIGTYKSISKNSYMKAKVYFNTTNPPESINAAGTPRIMNLMKGDGLTYIYTEYMPEYAGRNNSNGCAAWLKTTTFMLTSIKDRFGHEYKLEYYNNPLGRNWLKTCPGSEFTYPSLWNSVYYGLRVKIRGEHNYTFLTDQFNSGERDEHRPRLQQITNPSGETMIFNYEPYSRLGEHLYDKNGGREMSIEFQQYNSPLYRLSQVQNFDGGKKVYNYFGQNSLSLDYNYHVSGLYAGAHSVMANYKGQGRDLFFCNMISEVTESDNNVSIKKVNYEYNYNIYSPRNEDLVWQNPVDENDDYYTRRTVISLNNDNKNNTPDTLITEKLYRNFRVKARYTGEGILDFNGTTKLVEDKYCQNNIENVLKKMNYFYCRGALSLENNIYPGTFLDSVRTETIYENSNPISRTWTYSYEGGIDNSPLTMKREIDPMGRVVTTYFHNFERPNLKVFDEGIFNDGYLGDVYDTVSFYLIHQPDSIVMKNKDGIRLQKKEITYYNPYYVTEDTIVSGYPGQVNEERDIDPINNNVIRSVSYKYYNQDTTGRHIYNTTWVNPNDGNLKEITDANGNKTRYYYDLIARHEDAQYTPNGQQGEADQYYDASYLTYHKIKDDGTDVEMRTNWRDPRLPSRIDNFVNGSRYISHYQQYNEIGNPTLVLNENNYLSEAKYDKYFRLASLTLPYDFNDIQDTTIDSYKIDTLALFLTSNSDAWGHHLRTLSSEEIYFSAEDCLCSMEYVSTLKAPEGTYFYARDGLVRFDNLVLAKVNILDSAFLEFAPFFIYAKLDGEYINDYSFTISPLLGIQWSGNPGSATYTEGNNSMSCGNLNVSNSNACDNVNLVPMIERYDSNFRRINITSLLAPYTSNGGLNVRGLKFRMPFSGSMNENGNIRFEAGLYCCYNEQLYYKWHSYYKPRMRIYTRQVVRDTIRTLMRRSGSLIYTYDDAGNKVTIESKIDKQNGFNRNKKVVNYFDGFGYLKQSKIYTSADSSNSFTTKYNYLYQKAKTYDAYNDSTKFSYDKFGALSRTDNADNSVNYISNTFQNSLVTEFYSISNGFVNKQVYTDETNRKFEKYYDAVGNLLREVKYITDDGSMPDSPFDPDTTIENYPDLMDVPLVTDYRYDDLYRVVEVKTPANKRIYYSYDLLGRQTQRTTPDAGLTKYSYDANNNLVYSQDANQRARGTNIFTFRNYDGLNRLLSIGEMPVGNLYPSFENMDPQTPLDVMGNADQLFTVNVYDSLIYSSVNVFTNVPTDYYVTGQKNNTKGALVATAYRTKLSDAWGYKFYRYDARGRVTKMWHFIAGLGWKTQLYNYNSQNQVTTLNYNPSNSSDGKMFCYSYDSTDRLKDVKLYSGIPSEEMNEDYPGDYFTYASYDYNKNSQISHYKFNDNTEDYFYTYNSRNWVTAFRRNGENAKFTYGLVYNTNGNIRISANGGGYRNLFDPSGNPLNIQYIYDKSNRLLKSDKLNESNNSFDVYMSYDNDGNFLTLNRYGSNANIIDNYSYSYYIGTNKLQRVSGQDAQYLYDENGNMTRDGRDANSIRDGMVYDNRNLLIEMTLHNTVTGMGVPVTEIRKLVFDYDEAGNRVRKREYLYQAVNPDPGLGDGGSGTNGTWNLVGDEYYSRDVSGKEIAIYHSNDLYQWNVWGTDNVGKITANGAKFFYLKDHLGTIRVVLDASNNIVSANDYDCWGYPLENRSYQSGNTDYKFTGKQRDKESGYDYFGARYYDARIGRWGGVEPLLEKYISYTPYQYGLLNPMRLVDVDGKELYLGGDVNTALNYIQSLVCSDLSERITVNNNKVSFNTEGLDVSSDAGMELLDNLVNNTDGVKFLFEVANETYGIQRTESKKYNIGDKVPFILDKEDGYCNLSVESRYDKNENPDAPPGQLPKDGFHGQVTFGTGKWYATRTDVLPTSDIVFHELAENYYRTVKHMPYKRKDESGAHQAANDYSKKYKNQSKYEAGKFSHYEPEKK